jgi:hypothetical protein
MPESHQLTGFGEMVQRLSFEARLIVSNVVKHLWLEYEETTIDPALTSLGFFRKLANLVAL